MPEDYTPQTWVDGDEFQAAQATAMSQELQEQEQQLQGTAETLSSLTSRIVALEAVAPSGGGMAKSVYDPTNKAANAFSQDNMAGGTTNKNYTATEQTKLSGIAPAATANATNAELRDRATHTGTQSSSTITDFTEAVQDAVAALLAAGTNVSLDYDDDANTLTVAASGGGSSDMDAEAVRDAIGIALVGLGNITITVNDEADTITITTTATVNDTDANLKARANHTGVQSTDTITGLAEFIRDTVAAALVEGTGIDITVNDAADTITVAATGGGGGGDAPLTLLHAILWDGDSWPTRPADGRPVSWRGGDAPADAPPEWAEGDDWLPTTGDNVDLGAPLEALQGLTPGANKIPVFDSVSTADLLTFKTTMDGNADDAVLSESAVKAAVEKLLVSTKTAAYTLVATDQGTVVEYNSTSPGTFTVANVFEYGHVISFQSINTGILTIAAGSGVTINSAGGKFKLAGQWSVATLHFREPTGTQAILSGDLVV